MSLGTRFAAVELTIPENNTVSDAKRTGFKSTPVAIIFPTMVGTSVTFKVSYDGVTFLDLYDKTGTLVTVNKVAGYRALDPDAFMSVQELKVVSSNTETSEVKFKIICRPVS